MCFYLFQKTQSIFFYKNMFFPQLLKCMSMSVNSICLYNIRGHTKKKFEISNLNNRSSDLRISDNNLFFIYVYVINKKAFVCVYYEHTNRRLLNYRTDFYRLPDATNNRKSPSGRGTSYIQKIYISGERLHLKFLNLAHSR